MRYTYGENLVSHIHPVDLQRIEQRQEPLLVVGEGTFGSTRQNEHDAASCAENLAVVQRPTNHLLPKSFQHGGQVSRQLYLLVGHEASSDQNHDVRAFDTMLGSELPTDPRLLLGAEPVIKIHGVVDDPGLDSPCLQSPLIARVDRPVREVRHLWREISIEQGSREATGRSELVGSFAEDVVVDRHTRQPELCEQFAKTHRGHRVYGQR
ncbi:MAG: hypothetical protein AMJ77_06540 [Dehalococcoidia bacterium SM23_28_2]|nr:MAG: hypothetical protein AMJ77_06540 [Dehalococcoidia bacterium SM23_28_2]